MAAASFGLIIGLPSKFPANGHPTFLLLPANVHSPGFPCERPSVILLNVLDWLPSVVLQLASLATFCCAPGLLTVLGCFFSLCLLHPPMPISAAPSPFFYMLLLSLRAIAVAAANPSRWHNGGCCWIESAG